MLAAFTEADAEEDEAEVDTAAFAASSVASFCSISRWIQGESWMRRMMGVM